MNAKQVAGLVNDIKPDISVPIHYGTVAGDPGDGKVFAENVKEPVKVEGIKTPFDI